MVLVERVGRVAEVRASWDTLGLGLRLRLGRELGVGVRPRAGGRSRASLRPLARPAARPPQQSFIRHRVAPRAAGEFLCRVWRRTVIPARRTRQEPVRVGGEIWAPSRCFWPSSAVRTAHGVGALIIEIGSSSAKTSAAVRAEGAPQRAAGSAAAAALLRTRAGSCVRSRVIVQEVPLVLRIRTFKMGSRAVIHG